MIRSSSLGTGCQYPSVDGAGSFCVRVRGVRGGHCWSAGGWRYPRTPWERRCWGSRRRGEPLQGLEGEGRGKEMGVDEDEALAAAGDVPASER